MWACVTEKYNWNVFCHCTASFCQGNDATRYANWAENNFNWTVDEYALPGFNLVYTEQLYVERASTIYQASLHYLWTS